MSTQRLTLTLDGITAADYVAWVCDPEPPALGRDLCSVDVHYEPLGAIVEVVLRWAGEAPEAGAAATAAGFPVVPEVTSVIWRRDGLAARRRRAGRRIPPRPAIAAA
jgi:hypothetical protein